MSASGRDSDGNPDAPTPAPLRIVSGGQTGVDRAALDAALAAGVAVGGWCPRGRAAEDGPIPIRYPLRETAGDDPRERTYRNVRESDATLVVAPADPQGGTRVALSAAAELERPLLVVDPAHSDAVALTVTWVVTHAVQTLNVAGPRESEWPDGYNLSFGFVAELLRRLGEIRGEVRT